MITYITALYEEAKIIIDKYKMKKRLDETFFQYFASSDAELIITGVGYPNVFKSISRHFSLRVPSSNDIVVNIGICGSTINDSISNLYYINKITDSVFDRYYYPDLLFKNSFNQASVTSYKSLCDKTDDLLADMEAAPLYEALSSFFSPDRVFFFKIVSDYIGVKTDFSKISISDLISSHFDEIDSFIRAVSMFYDEYTDNSFSLTEEEQSMFYELSDKLSLTQSMRDSFYRLLKFRNLNNQCSTNILADYLDKCKDLVSKNDKKNVFNELKTSLMELSNKQKDAEYKYYDILNPGFTNVYVENSVDVTSIHLSLDLSNRNVIRINSYKEIFNRSKQNIELQKLSQSLILAENKGTFVYKGADVCQSFGNKNFYYCSTVMNCVFNCDYCYLGGMYPSGFITVYCNIDKAFEEITELLKKGSVYLCISYDTDLLALENHLGYVEKFIDFARENPELVIEIRSKFGNTKLLERLNRASNVIFAWTFSPDSVSKISESKSSPLISRINALKKAIDLGYKVRVCIDPIIYTFNWEEEYSLMIDKIFENVSPQSILDASIGVFRISSEYLKLIRKRKPNSLSVAFPFVCENNVAHYGDLSEIMIETVKNKLQEYIPSDKIYIWENEEQENL